MRLLAGSAIDIGQRRSENQDHLYTWTGPSVGLYIVADGMGGLRAGGLASELAIEALTIHLQPLVEEIARGLSGQASLSPRDEPTMPHPMVAGDGTTTARPADDDVEVVAQSGNGPATVAPLFTSLMDSVATAIDKTSRSILRHAREHPEVAGLGSTATLVVVVGAKAIVANLGDSRIYMIRQGAIQRVTNDHSLVATLVAMGQITDDEAYTHPQRNLIYRSLGSDMDAEPDVSVHSLQPGDTLILCSDGLWDMVRDDAILATVQAAPPDDPRSAAEGLVSLANDNGGDDNISVIVVHARDD